MAEPHIIAGAQRVSDRVAVVDREGAVRFGDLLAASAGTAGALLDGRSDLEGAPVVFLVPPGRDHVVWQWGIWRAGGIAVPIAASQAVAEWDYIVADTGAVTVVSSPEFEATLRPIAVSRGARFRLSTAIAGTGASLPDLGDDCAAMILYTSGTSSRPKGVLTTHANLDAQIATLVDAWHWTADDRVLHVLPLNHVHGIVNVLCCALWAGATCEFLSPFDAASAWERLASGRFTLFMAVPTIYSKLLAAWDAADPITRSRWTDGASRLRLTVSGSAALPVAVLNRWRAATGQVLLERYGMTEIGMALSNPLVGTRRPGSVGTPLPGVEIRLVDDAGVEVAAGTPGEIEVRGPGVFREYWHRPAATEAAFHDGWFRTGDVAIVEDGSYRILGRLSADIIKTGGYKVSALEIEEVLREHPAVEECAVVGVADEDWGERVAAALVLRPGETLSLDTLRAWAAPRLATYKLPTRLAITSELPRNAMGKVVKAEVRKRLQ